jgi:hypothetical protein
MASAIRVIFFIIGLAIFVYLIVQLGPEQILSLLQRVGWNFGLIIVIQGVYQLVRTGALWQCLVEGNRLAYMDLLWIRVSGEAVQILTVTGPFLGEPAKAWLLKRRGLTTAAAFAAVIAEFLIYTFTSAAIAMTGLAYLVGYFELGPAAATAAWIAVCLLAVFLLISAIAIVFRIYLIGAIINGIARLPVIRGYFRPDMAGVHRMEDLLLLVLRERPARFLGIILIELVAQALLIFELYWILRTMHLSFPMVYPFLIEAAIKFIRQAFFFVPAQVGVAEGAYAFVFEVLGLPAAAGFALSFVRRLRRLLVAGVGIVCLWLLSGERRQIQ